MCVASTDQPPGRGFLPEWALTCGQAAPSGQGQCCCELEDRLWPGGGSLGGIHGAVCMLSNILYEAPAKLPLFFVIFGFCLLFH